MIFLKKLMLCLSVIGSLALAYGQQVNEVEIGDALPQIQIANVYNADPSLSTTDLLNDGPLIISFWATWCSPCIEEMGVLDSLMAVYDGLNVLAITYQDKQVIDAFMDENPDARPNNVIISTNDTLFNKFFKHQALPHNVWVGREGTVVAATGRREVREENISELVAGKMPDVEVKIDIPFDYRKPLHVADSLIHFRSIFQPYIAGVNISGIVADPSGLGKPNARHFFGFNLGRLSLAWVAYTRDNSGIVNYDLLELRTSDSTKYFSPELKPELFATSGFKEKPEEWRKENAFFYELSFPEKVEDDVFFDFIVRDIE